MKHVIVLAGGTSSEREVSLRSGAAVAAALQTAGYNVTQLDPAEGLADKVDILAAADMVFPVLHGTGGEDGTIQQFLEEHGIRFVGSDSRASALCFDKWRYTQLLQDKDIMMPATELVDATAFLASPLTAQPFVLKPNDGGSSIDTFIIRDAHNYNQAMLSDALTRHNTMLLQELITGTEITIGVLGDTPLPVVEIIPPQNGEFDYENKYNGATQELCPPLHVSNDLQAKAQALALRIHTLTGCKSMSRTDMIIAKDQTLYVLETNTIPGMTDQSLYPKAARTAGIPMSELVDRLVRSAL